MRQTYTDDVIYYPLKTEEIAQMRLRFGLSVEACAKFVYCNAQTWKNYELGTAKIPPALWELLHYKITGRPPQTPKKIPLTVMQKAAARMADNAMRSKIEADLIAATFGT